MKFKKPIKLVLIFDVLMLGSVAGLYFFIPAEGDDYICFLCRLRKTDYSILGIEDSVFRDSDYSRWYLTRYPTHLHHWRHVCRWRGTLFSQQVYCRGGSFPQQNPMWNLPEKAQRAYVESAALSKLEEFNRLVISNQVKAVAMVLDDLDPENAPHLPAPFW